MKLKKLLKHFDRPETRIVVSYKKYCEYYGEFLEYIYRGDISKLELELLERKVIIWHIYNGKVWVKVK